MQYNCIEYTDTALGYGMTTETPVLAGIHHLKLPVTDLARSLEWYRSRLGYQVQIEFTEQGTLMGYALTHPAGGPDLALRLDPDRARAAAGFDYFAIGTPDKAALERLARALDAIGQPHAGVHRATMGWILPEVLDPDGHVLRFYTLEHHTDPSPGEVRTVRDPRESAERIERETAGREHPAARLRLAPVSRGRGDPGQAAAEPCALTRRQHRGQPGQFGRDVAVKGGRGGAPGRGERD